MSVVNINGFNCRYELSGNLDSSKIIIFINGIAGSLESWSAIAAFLTAAYMVLRQLYFLIKKLSINCSIILF